MDASWSKRGAYMAALAASVVALAVYTRTMLPGLGFWDTGEFQTVPAVLGIAHPTGYPFYTVLGKLFTAWPWGSIAYRLNLMSVFSAVAAVAALVLLAARLRAGLLLAVSAALGFAFSFNVWNTANRADPHTLHVAIVALLWLLAWRWAQTGDRRWLWGLALGAGLGMGNHMLMVMSLPGLGLYALLARPKDFLAAKSVGVALLLGLLGACIYAYIPLRAMMEPPLTYNHPTTWVRFRYLVLGEQFAGDMGFLSLEGLRQTVKRMPEVMGWYADWLTWPGRSALFGLAGMGLGHLYMRDRRLAVGLTVGFLIPFYAATTYVNGDLARYYLLPIWLLFLFAALGAEELIALWKEWRGERAHPRTALLLSLATLLFPAYLVGKHWAQLDQHNNRDAEHYQRTLLGAVKSNAVVISWWSFSTPLWYGRYVEGRRPDVTIIDDSDIVSLSMGDVMGAIARHYPRRPIYLVQYPGTLKGISLYYRLAPLPSTNNYGQEVFEVVGRTATPLPPPSTAANVLPPL